MSSRRRGRVICVETFACTLPTVIVGGLVVEGGGTFFKAAREGSKICLFELLSMREVQNKCSLSLSIFH